MKKIVLFALLAMLCFALSGCFNVQKDAAVSVQEVAATSEPETETEPDPTPPPDAAVLTDGENEEDDLPEDVTYELSDPDEEAFEFEDDEDFEGYEDFEDYEDIDIPRTLKPATAAQQRGVVKVDYVIEDKLFATQLDEIGYFPEDFVGKNLEMEGYVLYYDEGGEYLTQFAVVRDLQMPPHEHEEGEEIDHDDEEAYAVGFDCKYNGTIPVENSWARVIGTVVEYDYIDPESGEIFPSMYLKLLSLETLPEPSGARVVNE